MTMKKYLLLSVALFAFVVCFAQTRTDAEMDSIAMSVLGRNAQYAKSKGRAKNQMTFEKKRMENLTIVSNSTGAVIVSNHQKATPVLGYSFDYQQEELPCGYQWWLEAMDQSLSQKYSRKATIRPPSNLPSKVEPFVTSHWHQRRPYNNLCPDGTVAGCVAITLAQILYTYKYPVHGIGNRSYEWRGKTLSADFENTYYDWENMLDIYRNNNYTDQQAHAVAELVSHCGISVNMSYGSNSSSASYYYLYLSLHSSFDYNTEPYTGRSRYSDNEWMNMIFSDLSQGKPIAYCGEEVAGQAGHAFVLDGYDENGLIHVNWGWGYDDGYYDLSQIYPYNQQMIYGITPLYNTIDRNVYLAVQHALNGSVQLVVEQGQAYEYRIEPADGWRIHSVTFNGQDVTAELSANNEYKTPAISESSVLNVTFEEDGTGIAIQSESPLRVLAYGNTIQVSGAETGEKIAVYSADGKSVKSGEMEHGAATIVRPENQTYIVKGRQKTVKVRL